MAYTFYITKEKKMGNKTAVKGLAVFVAVMFGIISISGCGTVPKKFKQEVSGIKSRVETLESKVEGVESKQSDIERASSEQAQRIDDLKTRAERPAAKTNIYVGRKSQKSKPRIKEIQTCLKNAGFYSGKIDGIKGNNTKKAIKEFQKANGLKADGIVGAKTWEALSKYEEGAAQAPGRAEEGATK
jgi:outer membrane murein-binding lipoprotein Lpp